MNLTWGGDRIQMSHFYNLIYYIVSNGRTSPDRKPRKLLNYRSQGRIELECALKGWKDLLIQNLDLDRTTDKFLYDYDDDDDNNDGRVLKQAVSPQNFLQGLKK
jgi:hypothetical protein